MSPLQQFNNLHHAFVLLGNRADARVFLDHFFLDLKISPIGNPDVFFIEVDSFGVDDARALTARAQNKAFGSQKIFVISASRLTIEAENALLKTFEDPPSETYFFLIAPHLGLLAPTLLSRMQIIRLEKMSNTECRTEVEKFLNASYAKRLVFAKKFADDEKSLPEFLDALLASLKENKTPPALLKNIFMIRQFASDVSAMPRLILEHVALTVPLRIQ